MSILDLEKRISNMLKTKKTTVALDANIFKPFCNVVVPGLDLTKSWSNIINGYHILELITEQQLYNKEVDQAVKEIRETNKQYINLLGKMFGKYDNLILPIQVKQEIEQWIKNADLPGYWGWKMREERPFKSGKRNWLVYNQGLNSYFAEVFDAQFSYKILVKEFIENVPNGQVVDYEGDTKLLEIINQLTSIGKKRCNLADKGIYASSLLATREQKNDKLRIISFDKSFRVVADYVDQNKIVEDIATKVHTGYSFEMVQSPNNWVPLRFKLLYQSVDKAA